MVCWTKYWETSGDSITFDELVERRKELLQSQPKVYNIQTKMECIKQGKCMDNKCLTSSSYCIKEPKITNNSIKIIKKLS